MDNKPIRFLIDYDYWKWNLLFQRRELLVEENFVSTQHYIGPGLSQFLHDHIKYDRKEYGYQGNNEYCNILKYTEDHCGYLNNDCKVAKARIPLGFRHKNFIRHIPSLNELPSEYGLGEADAEPAKGSGES